MLTSIAMASFRSFSFSFSRSFSFSFSLSLSFFSAPGESSAAAATGSSAAGAGLGSLGGVASTGTTRAVETSLLRDVDLRGGMIGDGGEGCDERR